jgi:hypothetical protein
VAEGHEVRRNNEAVQQRDEADEAERIGSFAAYPWCWADLTDRGRACTVEHGESAYGLSWWSFPA